MSRHRDAGAAAAAVPIRRNTTLFVNGLPQSIATSDLTALFAQHGRVVECEVLVDYDNVSRGFGFVTMQGTDVAAKAKAALDGNVLPGAASPMKVRWALDKATLFVGDLGPDVTSAQLQEVRGPVPTSSVCSWGQHASPRTAPRRSSSSATS